MSEVGVAEAKAQFSELIERAAAGESITITKHGRPLVKIVSVEKRDVEAVRAAVAKFREQRKAINLGGLSIRALRDEGRP